MGDENWWAGNMNFVRGRLVTSFTVTTNTGVYLTVLNGWKLEDLEVLTQHTHKHLT
jgi:hypothetical protein